MANTPKNMRKAAKTVAARNKAQSKSVDSKKTKTKMAKAGTALGKNLFSDKKGYILKQTLKAVPAKKKK
jgi:hypothetical protein